MPYDPNAKQRGIDKVSRLPIRIESAPVLKKPAWLRVRFAPMDGNFQRVRALLKASGIPTVCQEASCPNIGECYGKGTASFLIMGDKCTRRCPFCNVGHGRPDPLDPQEPAKLAELVSQLGLRYVVVTSVDRDDLRDGGAAHFAACVEAIRSRSPQTRIEILVPDFRGRLDKALDILADTPPDVLNHNVETVPRLYRTARPAADYAHSLSLLRRFSDRVPTVPTKSGLMVGLGETDEEILAVMRNLRDNGVSMLTLGQYLAPSASHLPVRRYVHPDAFQEFARQAKDMGFAHCAAGPLVRSSYAADLQAERAGL